MNKLNHPFKDNAHAISTKQNSRSERKVLELYLYLLRQSSSKEERDLNYDQSAHEQALYEDGYDVGIQKGREFVLIRHEVLQIWPILKESCP